MNIRNWSHDKHLLLKVAIWRIKKKNVKCAQSKYWLVSEWSNGMDDHHSIFANRNINTGLILTVLCSGFCQSLYFLFGLHFSFKQRLCFYYILKYGVCFITPFSTHKWLQSNNIRTQPVMPITTVTVCPSKIHCTFTCPRRSSPKRWAAARLRGGKLKVISDSMGAQR